MTIPKAVREKLGLRVGDMVEVEIDNNGQMVARKVEFERTPALDWGAFAGKHRIGQADIVRLSRSARREVFKEEYG